MTAMTSRALFLTAVFLVFSAWLAAAARPIEPPPRESLSALPRQIGDWRGHDEPPLEPRVLAVLGADDHIARIYVNDRSSSVLSLYIGYHGRQQQDDSIHSPMNCLPGAGWLPVYTDRVRINDSRGPAATATVNRVVVQKGEVRQLVFYWYQSMGRIVASEYASKAQLFVGALRTGRSDAALVRIMGPVTDAGESAAQTAAEQFTSALLPLLRRHIPE